mmetsp:Transcript_7973/g.10516  ORF Transcript_7973/g.10516 Transcript_7973/m.10516 type:complete len:224 (-) Transcript_7973:1516-2187(-)
MLFQHSERLCNLCCQSFWRLQKMQKLAVVHLQKHPSDFPTEVGLGGCDERIQPFPNHVLLLLWGGCCQSRWCQWILRGRGRHHWGLSAWHWNWDWHWASRALLWGNSPTRLPTPLCAAWALGSPPPAPSSPLLLNLGLLGLGLGLLLGLLSLLLLLLHGVGCRIHGHGVVTTPSVLRQRASWGAPRHHSWHHWVPTSRHPSCSPRSSWLGHVHGHAAVHVGLA